LHGRLLENGGTGVRVRRLGGDRAGEMRITRFLRNRSVRVSEMLATAQARLGGAVEGRHVLAIQDTSVTRSKGGGGSYFHAMIAVDAQDGTLLGPLDAAFLHRTAGASATRHRRRAADKQSARWLASAKVAAKACARAARLTVIADREADMFEMFSARPVGTDMLIRAAHDRLLEDGGKLFSQVAGWPSAGLARLDLPAIPGRRARQADLSIRFGQVTIMPPKKGNWRAQEGVEVTLVELCEEAPPEGAKPLHWRLLTTHDVGSVSDALQIAALYRKRWIIEELFRLMKRKGFDIEALRIAEEAPRNKLITAVFIAAVHVMQMVYARDGIPIKGQGLRPVTDAFIPDDMPLLKTLTDRLQGKTERQKNPHPPDSLAYATWVCARLGGWTGYYGKPGPIVILAGWTQFQSIKRGAILRKTQDV
jgi:DDE family transposase